MSDFNRTKTMTEIQSLLAMGMTKKQVAEKLNEKGMKTASGKPWNDVRLGNLLHAAKKTKTRARPTKEKRPRSGARADHKSLRAWMEEVLLNPQWSDKKKVLILASCVVQ